MLPLFDGNEGDVVFALLGKLHIEDNGTSISVSTLLLLRKKKNAGISLAVQWLRLCTSIAGGMGSVPGQGTKIPHASRCGPKKIFF